MIAIATSLPRTSKARKKLSGLIIDTLWKSLQHPPLSYFGNKYQYRTADGSYNVSWKWHHFYGIVIANRHALIESSPTGSGQGWKPLCENCPQDQAPTRCSSRPWSFI